uniref:Histonelysine Nmethyltransferase SETD7like [Oryzias latipes] n=1 Tax=Lepeophtheirus salmonis TaxID=72036 RepID=A0A0K2TBP3_LEPSM
MRGKCSIPEINLISGFFRNGELEGSVYIISEDNIQGSAAVAVKGVLHGRVLTIGMKSHYPYPMAKNTINFNYNQVTMNGLGFYGYFLNGRASGTVWYGMVGHELNKQGLLYGKVDSKGKLSGSDISYIYPNHFNVLHGVFEDRIMKAAVYRHILELNCNKDSILEVKISGKPSNMETEQVYFYDPPSNTTLASPSMLIIEDPYEAETIYLSKSGIPNSGDGLHAKRDLEAGEVGAWYSGALFGEKEGNIWNNACRFNASLSAKSIAYCYKYRISTYHGALIDIPVDYDEESRYRSTLGHKMNNGFGNEVNTGFYQAEHPRFGTIVYILTTKPVPKGKELIVNYGYSRGLHHTVDQIFEWYFALEDEYNRKKEKERELNMASGFDTKPQI